VTRAILLRFHKAPLVCRSRVELLRKLNPGVPVYGVYGGDRRLLRILGRQLLRLDGMYASHADTRWNWQNGDFVLADWYRETGAKLSFDVLHFVEWDLILAAPLSGLYASVPEESLGLTALTPISDLEQEWTWLRREENRREWEALLAHTRERWGYDGVPYGCVAGAAVFPRAFLEAYAAVEPPPLCNDELRLPLFAQVLGFSIADTRLRGPWRGEREHPFFHFRAPEIELETIRAELAKPDGARAFHPVRRKLDHEMIFG
jgi:hypothetical protein